MAKGKTAKKAEQQADRVVAAEAHGAETIKAPIPSVMKELYKSEKTPPITGLVGKMDAFLTSFNNTFPNCDSGSCDSMIRVSAKTRVQYTKAGKTAHKKVRDSVRAILSALQTLHTKGANFSTFTDELASEVRAAAPKKRKSAKPKKAKAAAKPKAKKAKKPLAKNAIVKAAVKRFAKPKATKAKTKPKAKKN